MSSRSPPQSKVAPSFTPRSIQARFSLSCTSEATGPMSTPSSKACPTVTEASLACNFSTKVSCTLSSTIRRDDAVHFWPVPL